MKRSRAHTNPSLGNQSLFIALLAVSLCVGLLLILRSNAASNFAALEPEVGAITGAVTKTTSDSSASGNGYVTINTATPSLSGQFSFKNGSIIDPDGNPFLPRGINVTGAKSYVWSQDFLANGKSEYWRTTWNFNFIRLVYCETCTNHAPGSQTYGTIDQIVSEYTAKKMVVMIDYHEGDFCGIKTAAEREFAKIFFSDLAATYKDNPYVWFETFNEPMYDDQVDAWLQLQEPVVKAIRAKGNNNIIVLSEPSCGQARDAANIHNPFDPNDSGGYVYGQYLNETYGGNIMMDVHIYGRWGYGTTDDDLVNYFKALHGKNIPVLVGETASYWPGNEADNGQHKVGTERLYRVNYPGIGIIPWMAGQYNTDGGSPDDGSALHWQWSKNPPSATTPSTN